MPSTIKSPSTGESIAPQFGDLSQQLDPETNAALSDLSPKNREVILRQFLAIKQESFSGPLPHPDILRGYETIHPGFAERVFAMTEKEQSHRMECDRMMIRGTISSNSRGQWFGFIIAILFLAAAVYLAIIGYPWAGVAICGATLVGLVTVFVAKRPSKNEPDKTDTSLIE